MITITDDEIKKAFENSAIDEAGHCGLLGDILVEAGFISDEQRETALAQQENETRRHLGDILLERGYVNEEELGRAFAKKLGLPFIRLEKILVDEVAALKLDKRVAVLNELIPIDATNEWLMLAMANPFDVAAIDEIATFMHWNVQPVVTTRSDIRKALAELYGDTCY